MSVEITLEWFSGDVLLFCNHFVDNAASSEEMSSMQMDTVSFVLLGWQSCSPMLHAGIIKTWDFFMPKWQKKIIFMWWALPKEEEFFFPSPITLVLLWMEPALCKLSAQKRFGIMWVECLLFKGLQFAYSTKGIFLLFGQDQWKLLELPSSQPFKNLFLKITCQHTKGKKKNQQVERATKYKVKNNFKSSMWNFQSLNVFFIIYVTGSLFGSFPPSPSLSLLLPLFFSLSLLLSLSSFSLSVLLFLSFSPFLSSPPHPAGSVGKKDGSEWYIF